MIFIVNYDIFSSFISLLQNIDYSGLLNSFNSSKDKSEDLNNETESNNENKNENKNDKFQDFNGISLRKK